MRRRNVSHREEGHATHSKKIGHGYSTPPPVHYRGDPYQ